MSSTQPADERRAHRLELFFDLTFLAFVLQCATHLNGAPTWSDFGAFAVLLVPAWWAWVNVVAAISGEPADSGAGRVWLQVTLAMLGVGLLAAAVPDGLGDRAWAFAAGSALIRLVLFVAWWAKAGDQWRPVLTCGVTAALWGASALPVPTPLRFTLWGIAIGIEVAALGLVRWERDWLPAQFEGERADRFVVVIFGGAVLLLAVALDRQWSAGGGTVAVFGFAAIALLAWKYCTQDAERNWDTSAYVPFVTVVGLVLFAAGLATAVTRPDTELRAGATASLAIGLALVFGAYALRSGQSQGRLVIWAPLAIVLSMSLFGIAPLAPATTVAGWAAIVVGVVVLVMEVVERQVPATQTRV